MASEREICLDPIFERGQASLLEPCSRIAGERLGEELGERRAAPKLESLLEPSRRLLRVAGGKQFTPFSDKLLEAVEIELAFLDPQRVARRLREHAFGAERLAKLRDVALESLRRGVWRVFPEVVDEPVDRDHAVPAQQKKRQEGAWLRGGQGGGLPRNDRFDRSEDAKFRQTKR